MTVPVAMGIPIDAAFRRRRVMDLRVGDRPRRELSLLCVRLVRSEALRWRSAGHVSRSHLEWWHQWRIG